MAISLAGLSLIGGAALVGYAAVTTSPMPELADADWSAAAAGPAEEQTVYWVGHSLFNHRDPTVANAPHLMEEVGRLAEADGLGYRPFDHTLFGATLSLAVRGQPHSYARNEPELAAKMDQLRSQAAEVDALVLTDGIPIRNAEGPEYSAYYAMRFYCELARANPGGRVYLYEGPVHLQASDPDARFGPRDEFGWASWMEADRISWERIADQASTGRVPAPGLGARLNTIVGRDKTEGCEPAGPIFLIPAATVYVHLAERLADPGSDDVFELANGERLTTAHLFQNPYTDWPETWPLPPHEGPESDEQAVIDGLSKRHPDEPYDDVHPSRIGTYVAALTAQAVIYRRSPVVIEAQEFPVDGGPSDTITAANDAPAAAQRSSVVDRDSEATGLSPATIRTLRRLVWDVVRTDPRTGIEE